ncbi:hypothetical protein D3C71_1678870 [compost metagenome]
MQNNVQYALAEFGEPACQLIALSRMLLDQFEFLRVQAGRFVQYVFGYRQFPDVVQQAAYVQIAPLIKRQLQLRANIDGVSASPLRMSGIRAVPRIQQF